MRGIGSNEEFFLYVVSTVRDVIWQNARIVGEPWCGRSFLEMM